MGKLWIYGDSYAATFEYLPATIWPWTNQVGDTLDFKIINKAMHGSSLDYMMYESFNDSFNFNEDDTCIFVLTQLSRSWQIKKEPGSSYTVNRHYDIDHHADLRKMFLECWIHLMEKRTEHLKLRPLIIPAWDPEIEYRPKNIGWAKGELSKSSFDEIIFPPNTSKEHPDTECRFNHLCIENHTILADMVIDWFLTQKTIDSENLLKEIIPLEQFKTCKIQNGEYL